MNRAGLFGAFERMLALRYLRARREEGFLSVIAAFSLLGIMLGVGTLIVVMSVMNGFRDKFLEQILGFQGDISVLSRDAPKPLHDFDALVASIRQVPGVTDATPILDGQVLIQSDAKRWMGVAVRGTPVEDLLTHKVLDRNVGPVTVVKTDVMGPGYQSAYGLLAGLATPLVLSVHTIVSFDFAVSQLPGWHTTVFPQIGRASCRERV